MELMRRICEVCNTNSFEVVISRNEDCTTSLRGVYPIGAFQNHCCVPNTRHHFDDHQRLYVSASLPIAAGEELTMSYTDLLWDTSSRRQFLRVTKRFSCNCSRCSDPSVCRYTNLKKKNSCDKKNLRGTFLFFPQEFGSYLGALLCAKDDCSGYLVPRNPLNLKSPWICDKCQISMNHRQVISKTSKALFSHAIKIITLQLFYSFRINIFSAIIDFEKLFICVLIICSHIYYSIYMIIYLIKKYR